MPRLWSNLPANCEQSGSTIIALPLRHFGLAARLQPCTFDRHPFRMTHKSCIHWVGGAQLQNVGRFFVHCMMMLNCQCASNTTFMRTLQQQFFIIYLYASFHLSSLHIPKSYEILLSFLLTSSKTFRTDEYFAIQFTYRDCLPGAEIRHQASHRPFLEAPPTLFVFLSTDPHQHLHNKLFLLFIVEINTFSNLELVNNREWVGDFWNS